MYIKSKQTNWILKAAGMEKKADEISEQDFNSEQIFKDDEIHDKELKAKPGKKLWQIVIGIESKTEPTLDVIPNWDDMLSEEGYDIKSVNTYPLPPLGTLPNLKLWQIVINIESETEPTLDVIPNWDDVLSEEGYNMESVHTHIKKLAKMEKKTYLKAYPTSNRKWDQDYIIKNVDDAKQILLDVLNRQYNNKVNAIDLLIEAANMLKESVTEIQEY